jgi:hypothetical protein
MLRTGVLEGKRKRCSLTLRRRRMPEAGIDREWRGRFAVGSI